MWTKLRTLKAPLILTLLGVYFLPNVFLTMKFLGFAPLLTITISRLSLPITLFISLFSGLFIDLYSPGPPLGFFALNYTLTSLIVYRYRKYFMEEKTHIFALFSTLFSFVSTIIHLLLYALIDIHLHLKFITVLTDVILMPIFDGIYSLVFVLFPLRVYNYLSTPKRKLLYKAYTRKLKMIFFNQIDKMRAFTHAR